VAARRLVRGHQILLNFGLAIDADDLGRQAFEVDAMAPAIEGDLDTSVGEPLAG